MGKPYPSYNGRYRVNRVRPMNYVPALPKHGNKPSDENDGRHRRESRMSKHPWTTNTETIIYFYNTTTDETSISNATNSKYACVCFLLFFKCIKCVRCRMQHKKELTAINDKFPSRYRCVRTTKYFFNPSFATMRSGYHFLLHDYHGAMVQMWSCNDWRNRHPGSYQSIGSTTINP